VFSIAAAACARRQSRRSIRPSIASSAAAPPPPLMARFLRGANGPVEHSHAALADGSFAAVRCQGPGHEARSAVRIQRALADGPPFEERAGRP